MGYWVRVRVALSYIRVSPDPRFNGPLPSQLLPYVASLASRAVITCNEHPEPTRFAQICKPQSLVIERSAL